MVDRHSRRAWGIVVGSIAIAASSFSAAPPARSTPVAKTRPGAAAPARVQLPLVAFQQTTSYTCGPATLLTLLHYYHRDGSELEIAKEAHCTPEKGTDPAHMAAWLEQHGFQVTWGEHGSLAMLRDNLAKGVPTIVEWIDWGGHWVTVVGYDTKGTPSVRDDEIVLADPADGVDGTRDGLTTFNAAKFDAMWFDAFLFDRPMFKVYITAVPTAAKAGTSDRGEKGTDRPTGR